MWLIMHIPVFSSAQRGSVLGPGFCQNAVLLIREGKKYSSEGRGAAILSYNAVACLKYVGPAQGLLLSLA